MNKNVPFKKLAWLILAVSAASASWAQTNSPLAGETALLSPQTNGLTLQNAIQLALANNPDLRASGGRVEAAEGRAYQAGLWPNPALFFSAEDIPVDGGQFRESKNTIGMEQTVPFPGKKRLDKKIGASGVRLGEAELALRRLELVRDVKIAFYKVLAAEQLVGVSRELVKVAESSSNMARKRVAAGAAADQELLRAEIQLDQARTELAGAERDSVSVRFDLGTLLGKPELKEAQMIGVLAESSDNTLLRRGTEALLAQHPSVVAARTAQERSELELKRARLEPYPDVTLAASGGREGPGDESIVEFRISLPLPIIDRSKGRKQEAKANANVAQAELAATEQRLLREWGIMNKRFRTAAEQVAAYRDRILPRANNALRLVQTGFDEGKFGFIDLLDTQRTTAEVRLAYQQKLLELNVAQAELEALIYPYKDGVSALHTTNSTSN